MSKQTDKWRPDFLNRLKDPECAKGYLEEALEEGDSEYFIKAVRNVVEAQGGIGELSKKTGMGRTSLYKTLGGERHPKINNLIDILHPLGFSLTINRLKPTAKRTAKRKKRLQAS